MQVPRVGLTNRGMEDVEDIPVIYKNKKSSMILALPPYHPLNNTQTTRAFLKFELTLLQSSHDRERWRKELL